MVRKVGEANAYFDATAAMPQAEDWLHPNRCAILNRYGNPVQPPPGPWCNRPKHEAFYDRRDQALCLLGWEQGLELAAVAVADVERRALKLMASE